MQKSQKPKHSYTLAFSSLTLILICLAGLLMLHVSTSGEDIHLDSGMTFQAKDPAKLLILLALMIVPFPVASFLERKFQVRTRWLALIASFCMMVFFPFMFSFFLWQHASYPDGKPMLNFSGERVKNIYAELGYQPLWKSEFTAKPAYERYETNDRGIRTATRGNFLWGDRLTYGLNRKGWLIAEDSEPDKVYECIFERMIHVLGFYVIDKRGIELEYVPESSLPKDRCHRIDRPDIGSDIQ
jgi:hypothetical protein